VIRKVNFLKGFLLVCLLAGCAAQQAFKDGRHLLDSGKTEEGLAQMEKAYKLDPENSEYRSQYFRRREIVVFQFLSQAEAAKKNGAWEDAEKYYQRIQKIDPDNPRAKTGLSALASEKKQAQLLDEAQAQLDKNNLVEAAKNIRLVLAESPSQPRALELRKAIETRTALANQSGSGIKSKLVRPITIEFKDAPIQAVFELISKSAGINFILDKEVRPDQRVNLFVRDARIEDVIRFVLVTNQLEQRVLNSNTLFIYPNTPQKQKDFQELQIRNFYLTNASAKDVATMLKGMVKTRDLNVDEKLNLITMRDTPDAIRVAERLIAAYDIAEPEVMLEVEVLEVGTNLLDTIGVQYPSQISYSAVGAAGKPGVVTLPELINRNAGLVQVTLSDPALVVNLLHQDGDTNLLANPRIRVKNHEKANVHIGDKLPVITNTIAATGGFNTQSISYLDVGLKLDVEPTVYLDNEVGIKVGLEVSSITKQIQQTDGSLVYQIGTRTASTTLRLKDGETQILAGLINKEDRKAANSIPGLGQLPIIGRLFSSRSDTASKTEVVLLITPRVVRNIVRPESPIEAFSSGTESEISLDSMEINRGENVSTADKAAVTEPTAGVADSAAMKAVEVTPVAMPGNVEPSGATSSPAMGNVKLTLDMPAQVQAGNPFTVKINLAAEGLQNALMDMSFDPAILKVVNVTEGDLLKKPDGKTQFMQQVQDKAGHINLSVIRQGNVQGEGMLASVTFQPLPDAVGTTQVRVGAANFSDAAGRMLPLNTLPAAIIEVSK
jgi:general secretion pathway protein D